MFHWLNVLVHKTCTALINVFELEGGAGWVIRLALGWLWVLSIMAVCGGIKFCSTDIHVRFWLHGWPMITLLGDFVMLTSLLILAVTMEFLTLSRHSTKGESPIRVQCIDPLMHSCKKFHKEVNHRKLQKIFMSLFFFSIIVIALGAGTLTKGTKISAGLLQKCGENPTSRELQATWKKLDTFYEQCDPLRRKPIRECPNFPTVFPPPSPMVRYLEVIETKKGCSGFCNFGSKPLFTPGQGGGHSQFPTRCSSILGEDLQRLSLYIGVPSITLGSSIALMSLCLYKFDNL